MSLPSLRVLPDHDRRLRAGSPWLYANEVDMERGAKLDPGSVVRLLLPDGKAFGLAHFNPHSLIAARLLARRKEGDLPADFLETRLARARQLRDSLYDRPFYRLVHAEADGLPGLIVDRFGDGVVAQLNTAGMDRMRDLLVAALLQTLKPAWIVLRNDAPSRVQEGLATDVTVAHGTPPSEVIIEEGGARFVADPVSGQKTGWFYDQSQNRGTAARLGKGRRVLDVYAHTGGFGLRAVLAGGTEAVLVDRSRQSLTLAQRSAELNGIAKKVAIREGEAFGTLEKLADEKQRFGLVIADPPAFVKVKKDLKPGLRGYAKLARQSATLVEDRGFLVLGCCSHHVDRTMFLSETYAGIREAGRGARLIHEAAAGPDHPVHPALPESAYLKLLVYALD